MRKHGNCGCPILPIAMAAVLAVLVATLQPASAQREETPVLKGYDFEDLGIDIDVPGFVSEPIDSLISVFDDDTPTAEEEALAAEKEALAAEKEALAAEKEALAAEREALAAEKEALATEGEAPAAEAVAPPAEEQTPTIQIDISTEQEAPAAEEKPQPPTDLEFARALHEIWHDRSALFRVMEWVRATIDDIDRPLDQFGHTALHYVAPVQLDVMGAIVSYGADCNAQSTYGASPLHVAAAQEGISGAIDARTSGPRAIPLLVRCGADPNLQDNRGVTPLHAVYTSVELGIGGPLTPYRTYVGIVHDRGTYNSRSQWRNAYEASLPLGGGGGRQDILQALLEAGADPNRREVNGVTPLTMAIKSSSAAIARQDHIRLLLKHGADPDIKDIAGRTAIMHAIFSHRSNYDDDGLQAIQTLLAAGADPDIQDDDGATALSHAARKATAAPRSGGAAQEIALLLSRGADPCIADGDGRLPWDYTEENSEERDLLAEAGGARKESFLTTDFDGSTYDLLEDQKGCDTEAQKEERALALDETARKRLQACLVQLGFAAGAPDGAFGSATRMALRSWQEGWPAIEATGYLTEDGMATLLADCAPGPRPRCTGQEGEPACWIVVENHPGCYLWNPYPKRQNKVTWSGACVAGKASGQGKTTWRFQDNDGAWVTFWEAGEYREGRRGDGYWTFGHPDGGVSEAHLVDDVVHGLWILRGSNGRQRWCMQNGRQTDEDLCIAAADRAMQARRAAPVRSGPDENYEKLLVLAAGERVKVTGSSGGWLQVDLADKPSEALGFVRAELLEEAPRWQVGQVFRDCANCPEMVVVPAGSFTMGSPASEEERWDNEGPEHRVTISQPFAVGVYEVTFAEWDACASCGGYRPDDRGWGRGRRPVIYVSWDDAQAYVRWLRRETGVEYRLLSESEWEYVARAGTTTPFHTGETISTEQANYYGYATYGSGREGEYRERTVSVGSFSANRFGLHDVHGNVWEWVEDCWNGDYAGAPRDGSAWESGNCSVRVLRGGSWDRRPGGLRSAGRSGGGTGSRSHFLGFRVARTLAP